MGDFFPLKGLAVESLVVCILVMIIRDQLAWESRLIQKQFRFPTGQGTLFWPKHSQ
ncbi:hypothetical protein SH449x_004356 [Pirellulaceae bacterium SH449]